MIIPVGTEREQKPFRVVAIRTANNDSDDDDAAKYAFAACLAVNTTPK
jgi:hypothetical protein